MLIEFIDRIWQPDFSFLEQLHMMIILKLTENLSVYGQVSPTVFFISYDGTVCAW
jgi:hypothetical protein